MLIGLPAWQLSDMIFVAIFIFMLTAAAIVELSLGFAKIASLGDVDGDNQAKPMVSIIVPACNEADRIETGLRSLAGQDYRHLEIIVVNDRSTDSTGQAIERVRTDFPTIRCVDIKNLPPGWLGKPHALQQGASLASGEYLVFTDADVVLEHTTISRAVAAMTAENLDHLALVFKNSSSGGLLNAIITEVGAGLMWVIKPWRARIARSRFFVGVGAFNMVRKEVYEAIGRHDQVRMQVIDDLYLGRLIKHAGYAQDCLDGREFAAVPWYCSVAEMIDGLMKNVFAFFNYRVFYAALGVAALTLVVLLPYWGTLFSSGAARLLFIAAIFLRVGGIGTGLILSGVEKRALPWLFVTPFITIYIICRATFLTIWAGGITWRETLYPLSELRKEAWVLAGLFGSSSPGTKK